MTKILTKIWAKTQNQPLDLWFFYGFLLTFVLSVRKVLFYFPLQGTISERTIEGGFNEYAGIYVYISDIFLMFAILVWIIIILSNKLKMASSYKLWITQPIHSLFQLFHEKQNYFSWNNIVPFLLVIWSFISIFWSQNQSVALFRSIKLLELYLLFLYIKFRVKPLLTDYPALKSQIFKIIISVALFESLIAVWQFVSQHSVGLFWLKESLISPDTPGVAKIVVDGHKIIRAYGLFPHSNILGGFLLFSCLITLVYLRTFHGEHREKTGKIKLFIKLALSIQLIALLLTFSKSAILGLILSLVYLGVSRKTHADNEPGVKQFSLFHNKTKIIVLSAIILALLIFTPTPGGSGHLPAGRQVSPLVWGFNFKPDMSSWLLKPLKERQFYLDVSRRTILNNPALGVGMGQFVLSMPKYAGGTIQNWQFQPVHNVFLLIWSELGIVGLVLFGLFLWQVFHNSPDNDCLFKPYFKAILVGFIFIMLFDHYLWDIQQGELMLWMILGFI